MWAIFYIVTFLEANLMLFLNYLILLFFTIIFRKIQGIDENTPSVFLGIQRYSALLSEKYFLNSFFKQFTFYNFALFFCSIIKYDSNKQQKRCCKN